MQNKGEKQIHIGVMNSCVPKIQNNRTKYVDLILTEFCMNGAEYGGEFDTQFRHI